ncbi:MFS transporter [Candidatus Woesearchaeota archaeon]|nr:MFS transporter [Candidatus Woesearchaeota archaeon]
MKKSKVDKNIIFLGLVSFLTDISSEMIFSVFSVFFTVILGASTILLGLVEGLADFSASSLNYVSGYLSDKYGKRKPFTIMGYGFSVLAKFFLVIVNSVWLASAFRVFERLGKSFRGPPRDAWISSFTTSANRGLSFGVHKALDKAGAIVGPLIAFFIIRSLGESYSTFKLLFLIALVPAAASVLVLFLLKDRSVKPTKRENTFLMFKGTSKEYKNYLLSSAVFSLAYFSFSFLLLKAYLVGFMIKDVILLYLFFNLVFVIVSVPIGKLGDIIGRRKIIILSFLIYLLMSIGFIFARYKWEVIVLFGLFGIFFAIDEAQSKAYILDLEKKRKATALGMYAYVTGMVYLPASIIAGLLWKINPAYAFMFASLATLIGLGLFFRKK